MSGDTRHSSELPPDQRPRAVSPIVADLVPEERPWSGSVFSEIQHWRSRALAAERDLEFLRAAVRAGWRPHT